MPDVFDIATESPPQDVFDVAAAGGDVFDQAQPEPAKDLTSTRVPDLALRNILGGGRPVPTSGLELAAQNFDIAQQNPNAFKNLSTGRDDLSETPAPQRLINSLRHSQVGEALLGRPGMPKELGSDLDRNGLLQTAASIPARVGNFAGRAAKAGLGDIAAGIDARADQPQGAADFGGNLEALLRHDEKLPVERGLELSKEQDKSEHALGWQTIAADISLGLADLAPKIALMEGAPGGMLGKSATAADLFGFNDKGEFSPRSAAFAAAFPFVTKAAATVTDAAIQKAVDRGMTWAGSPTAQKAIHVAANQAAMDAIMGIQSAPELMKLAQTDPQEFKREVAKIMGSNLAFAIPEGLQAREPVEKRNPGSASEATRGPETPIKPAETPRSTDLGTKVPVTRDLAAELQAAMKGNQVAPADTVQKDSIAPTPSQMANTEAAAEKSAGGPDQSEAVKDNLIGQAVKEITGQIPGAKVTIEAPPAEAKPEFKAEDFAAPDVVQLPSLAPDAFKIGDFVNFSDSGQRLEGKIASVESDSVVVEAADGRRVRVTGREIVPVAAPKTEQAPQSKASDAKQSVQSEPGRPGENVEPTPGEVKATAGNEKASEATASDAVKQSVQSEPGRPAENVEPRPGEVNRSSASRPAEPTTQEGGPTGIPEPVMAQRVARGLRARKIFDRETEMNGPDILDWVKDSGGMLSKTGAKKKWGKEKYEQNKDLWDDAPSLAKPHHNVIYDAESTRGPDQVAQDAYDAGKLKAPDVRELWATIDKYSKARSHAYENERRHETILQEEIAQNKRWRQMKADGPIRVDAEELEEGDTMELAGEHFKVTAKDPETGDVTLEDGSKFGTQRLPSGDSVYVEKIGDDIAERLNDSTSETAGAADPIGAWLDRAIEATNPKQMRLMEGVTGVPVWLTETLANGALRVLRAAYRASRNMKASIEEALLWLNDQKIKGFDAHEGRQWLNEVTDKGGWSEEKPVTLGSAATAPSAPPADLTNGPGSGRPPKAGERDWQTVQAELAQADKELRAAIHEKQVSKASRAERTQKVSMATARLRNLQEELQTHPGYVEDLMTRHHELSEQLKAETDDAKRNELRYKAEQLASELGETPEALRNRVHQELQEKGVLPKPPEPAPVGRSLDDLTDWLKANDIDSPKRTMAERLDLAGRLADRWQGAKDLFDAGRVRVAAMWRAGLESIKHPPLDTGFRDAIKDWIFYDSYTGAQTKRWIDALKQKVDKPIRRMAISVWLDAKGDEGLLRYQATEVPERYEPVWRTALQLTADEKRIALQIKADFARKLEDNKTAGLIERGREDYGMPQLWKKAPEPKTDQAFATKDGPVGSPGNWAAKLDPRDPFYSLQREYPTYFEGIMHGGIAKSLDAADLVAAYNLAMHKALSSRAAIWALRNVDASDGKPLVQITGSAHEAKDTRPDEAGTYFVDSKTRPENALTEDGKPYRDIDHFALRDWKVATKTADGGTLLVRGNFLVHPEAYRFLKNELTNSGLRGEDAVGDAMKVVFKGNTFLKNSKLDLGTFHMATIANHAVFHGVLPVTKGFEIDLRQPDQALLVRHGLELGLSGPMEAFSEGLSSHGGLFSKIPGLGDLSSRFSEFLFKDYIPTLSMKTALVVLERNRQTYGSKLSDGQIAELTAHQMNAAFGLQNYRLLGRNKTILDFERLALLAPQFLESRVKIFGQALKPYGAEQRRMLGLQFAAIYVGARLLNSLFDKDPHWEPENAFSLVVNGRAYSLRTVVGDAWHMLKDLSSFASGRLSPLGRIAIETITQRDLRTGARKEPPIQTNWLPSRIVQNLLADLAKWHIPVWAEGLLPGAKGREQGVLDAALSSVGVGSRKYTAETQVAGWARDFNRSSSDPHARTEQRQRDSEARTEGSYRKLDALLDAGKLAQAATEYQALQADGHKDKDIAGHYDHARPFTGTKAGDKAFENSLDPGQKQMYERALAERKKRQDAFDELVTAMKLSKVAP